MSTESPRILVVDDDADIAKAARLLLERHGMTVGAAADPAAAWVALATRPADVILLDLNFVRGRTSGEEGFAMLNRLIAADRHAVVIVVTGHSGIAAAVQAMRGGASDFVIKPWNNERLLASVQRAVALRRAKLESAPVIAGADGLLLGESATVVRARDLLARIGPTDAPMLVRGPAGVGKTLVARLAHQGSRRADRPLVTLDADAALIVERTAEAADATLLIEHVDRLPRSAQPDLVRRLNGIRVIATSRLDRAALRAALDEELLYRLNTIELDLAPLHERGDDILLLARHFLALFAGHHGKPARALTAEAERAIAADAWPDNIRGLRQAAERAVLLGDAQMHRLDDMTVLAAPEEGAPRALASDLNLARSEEAMVAAALKRHAFNVSRAAAELGLTRAALYRRMARHGL